jgi:hypothetical protein
MLKCQPIWVRVLLLVSKNVMPDAQTFSRHHIHVSNISVYSIYLIHFIVKNVDILSQGVLYKVITKDCRLDQK